MSMDWWDRYRADIQDLIDGHHEADDRVKFSNKYLELLTATKVVVHTPTGVVTYTPGVPRG